MHVDAFVVAGIVVVLWCIVIGVAAWITDLDRYYNRK